MVRDNSRHISTEPASQADLSSELFTAWAAKIWTDLRYSDGYSYAHCSQQRGYPARCGCVIMHPTRCFLFVSAHARPNGAGVDHCSYYLLVLLLALCASTVVLLYMLILLCLLYATYSNFNTNETRNGGLLRTVAQLSFEPADCRKRHRHRHELASCGSTHDACENSPQKRIYQDTMNHTIILCCRPTIIITSRFSLLRALLLQ